MAGEKSRAQELDALYSRIQEDSRFRSEAMRSVFVPGCGCIESHPPVFVGEAPGAEEERVARPFVGPAGKNFDLLLREAGLNRKDVFVTNLIKYRPVTPSGTNRSPSEKERRTALPYLLEELGILQPRLVVCLGLSAAKSLLHQPSLRMHEANGSLFFVEPWKILVTYHPSPLNWVNTPKRTALQKVFQQMQEILHEPKIRPNRS